MAEPSAGRLAASNDGNVPKSGAIAADGGRRSARGSWASSGAFWVQVRQWWPYYAMMAPGLIFFIIWHYVPI